MPVSFYYENILYVRMRMGEVEKRKEEVSKLMNERLKSLPKRGELQVASYLPTGRQAGLGSGNL